MVRRFRAGRNVVVAITACLSLTAVAISQHEGERDTDFKIRIERVENADGYRARITTTSTYPCAGYDIRSRATWEGDTVSIRILGFVRPSPCVQMFSEATGDAWIGTMSSSVSFIRIIYRTDVDIYKIIRSDKHSTIVPVKKAFTSLWKN